MTPVLSAVYDELVAQATSPSVSEQFDAWVRRFLAHTGTFPADHPEGARRLDAAREDALCRGGWAARLAGSLSDPAEQTLAALLPFAHRGVFVFEQAGGYRIVRDILSGAAFVLVARDSVGREIIDDNQGAVCVARLVGAADGCAMLPGVVFHRADATPFIHAVTDEARSRGMGADEVCDAMLRMDYALQTLSRVRPAFAYRVEGLVWRDPTETPLWRRRESSRGTPG